MSKHNRNRNNGSTKQQEKEQAAENAAQGDKLEQALQASNDEPTVEQVQANVEKELEREDKVGDLTEEPKVGDVQSIPLPVEKPLTEVEPAKGLTPEQVEVAKALSPGKIERYPDRLRKSTQSSPVKMVHAIAETMLKIDPSTRRKDIVNFCVSQGIAFYTARTQTQVYLNAVKRDRENAAKQAAEIAAKNNHAA